MFTSYPVNSGISKSIGLDTNVAVTSLVSRGKWTPRRISSAVWMTQFRLRSTPTKMVIPRGCVTDHRCCKETVASLSFSIWNIFPVFMIVTFTVTNNSILSVWSTLLFHRKSKKIDTSTKEEWYPKCTGQMQPLSWDGDGGFDKSRVQHPVVTTTWNSRCHSV
jgi:hypothetical protein